MESGVNAGDEWFSLKVAVVLMITMSILASIASLLGLNPFSFSFNLSFVYLPTEALLLWTVYRIGQNNPIQ